MNTNIRIIGSSAAQKAAEEIIDKLSLSGNEAQDRLIIQAALEENREAAKAGILYKGNKIVDFPTIIRNFQKIYKTKKLNSMTDSFYSFCSCTLSDIAHYNKEGYIEYYQDDFLWLWDEFLSQARVPQWRTDALKVLQEMHRIVEGNS